MGDRFTDPGLIPPASWEIEVLCGRGVHGESGQRIHERIDLWFRKSVAQKEAITEYPSECPTQVFLITCQRLYQWGVDILPGSIGHRLLKSSEEI